AEMPPPIAPTITAIIPHAGARTPVDSMTTRASAGGRNPAATAATIRSITDLVKRLGVEAITDAAHGENQLRIRVILLDVLAQAAHVNVDGARLDESIAAPHQVKQLFARVDSHRMFDEEPQQFKLAQRQLMLLAVDEDLVGIEVHAQTA